MGYTHFWTLDKEGDQRVWADAISRALPAIIRNSPCPLAVEYGDHEIVINGTGPCDGGRNHCDPTAGGYGCQDDDGASHEDFILPTVLSEQNPPAFRAAENPVFYFCKTAQKSYDIPVAAVLAALATYAPGIIVVSSDGDASDWTEAVELARVSLGDPSISLPASVAEKSDAA